MEKCKVIWKTDYAASYNYVSEKDWEMQSCLSDIWGSTATSLWCTWHSKVS